MDICKSKSKRTRLKGAKLVAHWEKRLKICGLSMDAGLKMTGAPAGRMLVYAHETKTDFNRVLFTPNPGEGTETEFCGRQ